MRRLLPIILVFGFLVVPASLLAQGADPSFREYFQALPQRDPDQLKVEADGADKLQAGFALLELHRRTRNQAHGSRATRVFGEILKNNELDAWARLGLAHSLLRVPKSLGIVRVMGVVREREARRAAEMQLDKALALDPSFVEATTLLATLRKDPVERMPVAPSYTSGSLYFDELARADDKALEVFARDIAPIATAQELLSVSQGTREKRIAAFESFWKKRAVRDGVSPNERVVEHFRRISIAQQRYGTAIPPHTVYGKKRVGWESRLDDRGLIYVRFGDPDNREKVGNEISQRDDEPVALEVWAYLQPDGRYQVYYFIGGRMESDPLRIFGVGNAEVLEVLRKYDARYAFIAARVDGMRSDAQLARIPGDPDRAMPERAGVEMRRVADAIEDIERRNQRIVEKNRKMLFLAFEMDAARPRFNKPLTLFHDIATFRGRGCTDVVYSVAAPVPSYRLTLAVADTFTWDTQTIDSVVVGAVQSGDYLRSTGVFCTAPDHNSYVRITAVADSATGVTAGGEVRIPDYSGASLMMSDMLFANTQDGGFVRGAARLSLVPPRQFREGDPFRIFYELYNLPAGRNYRTEITLTTVDSNFFARLFKGRTRTTVTFEGVAEGANVVQELRTIVPQIEAGEAEVFVKVTDLVTDETTQSKKNIWIIPREDQK